MLPTPPLPPCVQPQEPVLALRRQLATLSGASAEAGQCWLQLARLCRMTGHHDAATTAVLEAQSCKVGGLGPGAEGEQCTVGGGCNGG